MTIKKPKTSRTTSSASSDQQSEEAASGGLVESPTPPEPTATSLVLDARTEMRRDMTSRLATMMTSLRAGLRAELVEMSSDMRDATLLSLADRLTSVGNQLAKASNPVLIPSLKLRLRELTGVLTGLFLQMLQEESPEEDVDVLLETAKEMALTATKELVPGN